MASTSIDIRQALNNHRSMHITDLKELLQRLKKEHSAMRENAAVRDAISKAAGKSETTHLVDYMTQEFAQHGLLYKSLAVTAQSILEGVMIVALSVWDNVKAPTLKITDLKGDGLTRLAEYFRIIAGVDIRQLNGWSPIHDLSQIRNFIVHSNGIHFGDVRKSKKYDEICSRARGLHFIEGTFLVIRDEYLDYIVPKVDEILSEFADRMGIAFHST